MEKDVEEGEEDEEEVTKYVHTYIFGRGGRDPQVKESKCISRQSSSVKRQDIKRQGIKHHGIHVYSHCMGGGGGGGEGGEGGDYVHTYIFGRGGRDPQVKESKCITRQSSSVKRQDIKRQGIKHQGLHVHSHCMAQHPSGRNGFNRDHITCWQEIICFLGEGPGVWK